MIDFIKVVDVTENFGEVTKIIHNIKNKIWKFRIY